MAPSGRALARRTVFLLALTAGVAVANIYYVQPLLNVVGRGFGVSDAVAGLLVTCAQVGYVVGLALLVPLGDFVERRGLIVRLLLAAAVASAACAAAPGFPVLVVALVALGLLSVVAQVVVALASNLAADHERGQVVGTVMSGLLVGILLARTVSGAVAEVGGWRSVFVLAAVALLALAAVLRRALPLTPRTSSLPYGALLASIVTLVREEPVLRQRMAIVACNMAPDGPSPRLTRPYDDYRPVGLPVARPAAPATTMAPSGG